MVGLEANKIYTDYQEMLAENDLDVVLLALPPELNYRVAHAVAKAGLDIICEKPVAVTPGDANAMRLLPEKYGVQLLIAENFRYEAAIQKCRKLVDAGRIGVPVMFSYRYIQPVPVDDEMARRPWRQKPVHAGGIFSDHGVHMIDVARYLMGDIAAVQVFGRDIKRHLVGLDTAVFNLMFRSGAIGSIQWSFAVSSQAEWHFQLWGDNGMLRAGPDKVTLYQDGGPDEIFPVQPGQSVLNEFVDFYDTLVNDESPIMTVQDAVKDLETVLAAHRSAEFGTVESVNAAITYED
jgi:UDP-N-acetylglucosamine 3-dehydrogenase